MDDRVEGAWRGRHLTDVEARAVVSLSQVKGVGARRMRELVDRFGSAHRSLRARPSQLASVSGIGPQTADRIASTDESGADLQIARARRTGARLQCAWGPDFFPLLLQLYDCPAFLWVRGRVDPSHVCVAVVGTRRATPYGKRVARKLGGSLAEAGAVVVSGLAEGIDIEAHKGALDAGGRTVAVLGSGVDVIYPGHHRRIAEKIVIQGAIISEYPMGSPPEAPNFPKRNRLISGLSRATVVVEAHSSGGALITARMALEQNRDVFAIAGPYGSAASEGCHRLVQEGAAALVHDANDILTAVGVARVPGTTALSTAPDEVLTPAEAALVAAVGFEPTHVSELCDATGLDAADALCLTLGLEMRGIIRQLPGRYFVIVL